MLARLRAIALLGVVLAAGACTEDDAATPTESSSATFSGPGHANAECEQLTDATLGATYTRFETPHGQEWVVILGQVDNECSSVIDLVGVEVADPATPGIEFRGSSIISPPPQRIVAIEPAQIASEGRDVFPVELQGGDRAVLYGRFLVEPRSEITEFPAFSLQYSVGGESKSIVLDSRVRVCACSGPPSG